MGRAYCIAVVALAVMLVFALPALADCPSNLARNPGFEGPFYAGPTVGTSVSSHIAADWLPWAILGDPSQTEPGYNYEPEYKILQRELLMDGWYRVYAGDQSQGFFSMYATHTAGFYQRIPVPEGRQVTFTIWVQVYTGQEDLMIDERYPVSDLYQPLSEPTRSVKGSGDYSVYVGIDPRGQEPDHFGAPLPAGVVWSQPVLDMQTRTEDAAGKPIDEWVLMSVSVRALSDYITVYTQGKPVYRTRHNDSIWDEACVQVEGQAAVATVVPTTAVPALPARPAASATPRPPAAVPQATFTPRPTAGAAPVAPVQTTSTLTVGTPSVGTPSVSTPPAGGTPPALTARPQLTTRLTRLPSLTPMVGFSRTPTGTSALAPTDMPTAAPTAAFVLTATPAALSQEVLDNPAPTGLALLYLLMGSLIAAVLWWIRLEHRP